MRHRTLASLRLTLATVALLSACSAGGPADPPSRASGGSSGAGVGGAGVGGAGVGGAVTTGGSASGGVAAGGVPPATGGANTGGSGIAGSVSSGGTAGDVGTGGSGTSGSSSGGTGTGGGVSGGPIGFATENGGTIGGLGGQLVTATTYADLKSYAESATPYIIMVEGTISNGANGGEIAVRSNKSIIGIGATAFLNGIGLDINSQNNIIIQNLRISLIGVTTRTETANVYTTSNDEGRPAILVNEGDAIGIRGTSKNIWIDHCEIFAEDPNVQANIDLYDGLIDIKNQTGFITISWNYLHDQHKGGLVGSSDTDLFADRKITYHHNYYNKVKLRVPMYRGSTGHFFNNYIVGAQDASEIRAGCCVRIEKNYYEALHYSIYTTAPEGQTQRIDNTEIMRTVRAYPDDCTADIQYDYAAALTANTADVKTLVPQGAGVGKI